MRFTTIVLFATSASAFSLPDSSYIKSLFARKGGNSGGNSDDNSGGGGSHGGSGSCPPVWTSISSNLTSQFLSNGQCNPTARAAIRAIFHDCGAWQTSLGATGGCDGSLALELDRDENNGLSDVVGQLKGMADWYSVSLADMIVFAGNHAIVTCPGGPTVTTWIGRKDATTTAPHGLLPDVNAPAADLSALFTAKGFSDRDLAALLGAHSTSNQFNVNTARAGEPQDSTPGLWDVNYYSETLNPPKGVFVFPSDKKLAAYGNVGKEFKGFVNNQGKWNGKFADAMGKMALFGSSGTGGMSDCTGALPGSTSSKRDLKGMNPFMPRH